MNLGSNLVVLCQPILRISHMMKNNNSLRTKVRWMICVAAVFGIGFLSGCKTVNKVNPVSDESYFQWLFALPHKAVKSALDIDEE